MRNGSPTESSASVVSSDTRMFYTVGRCSHHLRDTRVRAADALDSRPTPSSREVAAPPSPVRSRDEPRAPEIEISVLPVTTHVVNVIAPARRAEGRRSDPVVGGVIPARATFGALPSETIRRSCWDPRDWYNPCKTDGGVHGRPSDPRDVHFSLRPSS